jgi:hypothetical protein
MTEIAKIFSLVFVMISVDLKQIFFLLEVARLHNTIIGVFRGKMRGF